MRLILSSHALIAGLFLLLGGPALADDPKVPKGDDVKQAMKTLLAKAEEEYRTFFKKPETAVEYWAALQFEIQVGKFDVAGLHLDQLVKKGPAEAVDDQLLKIEEAEGMAPFLRLKTVRQWHKLPELQRQAEKNVETLLDRLTTALDKKLADPVRINKFINNLHSPVPEVRTYAFAQLSRSGARAAPYLLEALRKDVGSLKHQRLLEAMVRLEPDVMPPLFEALIARDDMDAKDADLRLPLLELIRRRFEKRAVPYLWHLSASPRYPEHVRAKARETLAHLLETAPERLPPPQLALTQLAEKLYEHRLKFLDPRHVRVWPWTKDRTLSPRALELTAGDYEEIFGLRYARQALDLDAAYRPAQVVFLNLMLERAYQGKLDQILVPGKTNPSIDQLLATIDADLVIEVLNRALADHNLAVILPTIKALGERGEARAARVSVNGTSGPLVRALNYPDRRVQYAAVTALLRLPQTPTPVISGRVVELLAQFFASKPTPRALVVAAPEGQFAALRKQLKAAGYEPVLVPGLKEAFAELHRVADIEAIFLHQGIPVRDLSYVLAQFRADASAGLLPLFLVSPLKADAPYRRFEAKYRNVWVLPEVVLGMPDDLKGRMEDAIKLSAVPDAVVRAPAWQQGWLEEDAKLRKGQKLSDPERKQFAAESFDTLWRMARGLVKGYDVRAAETAVLTALRNDETIVPAIEILATFPGPEPQQRLADLILDPKLGKQRVTAAIALNRHVQKNGLALNTNQLKLLRELHRASGADAPLQGQLAILMGSIGTTPALTGDRLSRFNPTPPPAPPPAPKK